jgi:hypothetical protein
MSHGNGTSLWHGGSVKIFPRPPASVTFVEMGESAAQADTERKKMNLIVWRVLGLQCWDERPLVDFPSRIWLAWQLTKMEAGPELGWGVLKTPPGFGIFIIWYVCDKDLKNIHHGSHISEVLLVFSSPGVFNNILKKIMCQRRSPYRKFYLFYFKDSNLLKYSFYRKEL